jgi:hypothetical protein
VFDHYHYDLKFIGICHQLIVAEWKYGVLGIDDKNKAFCSDHNAPVLFSGKSTIFIIFFYKICARSKALFNHGTH